LGEEQRRKTHAFAKHLEDVFQQHLSENEPKEEEAFSPLTNLKHQSNALKEVKFKKSSAI
jgi:hypothetical protein